MTATAVDNLLWFGVWIAAACLIGVAWTCIASRLNRHRTPDRPDYPQPRHVRVVPDPTVPRQLTETNTRRAESRTR